MKRFREGDRGEANVESRGQAGMGSRELQQDRRTSSRALANSFLSFITFSEASDQRLTTLVQKISSIEVSFGGRVVSEESGSELKGDKSHRDQVHPGSTAA